jgi:hypothetical protein
MRFSNEVSDPKYATLGPTASDRASHPRRANALVRQEHRSRACCTSSGNPSRSQESCIVPQDQSRKQVTIRDRKRATSARAASSCASGAAAAGCPAALLAPGGEMARVQALAPQKRSHLARGPQASRPRPFCSWPRCASSSSRACTGPRATGTEGPTQPCPVMHRRLSPPAYGWSGWPTPARS